MISPRSRNVRTEDRRKRNWILSRGQNQEGISSWGVIKGGVAEPLYLGSFVDAIIMRFMRRTSEVQSGRSRSQLLMEGLKLRRPVLLRWFVQVASFHLVRPPWPVRSIASSSD